jgi:hypothetical protein
MIQIPRVIEDVKAGLCLLFTSILFGDSLTNKKTKPYLSALPFINLTVHSLEALSLGDGIVKGKGARARLMERACDPSCRYIARELGGSGLCNQSRPLNHYANKIQRSVQAMPEPLYLQHYQLRATVWGDLSRVSPHVLAQILPIVEGATLRLGYVSGWRAPRMEPFKGLLQASVGSIEEAIEAHNAGWSPYGDFEPRAFRLATGKPAYRCPYDVKSVKGCSVCEIRCDGLRAVALKK